MARKSSSGGQSGGSGDGGGRSTADMIPDALREAGRRAAELAQNPVARSLLAAGLVTAAAALAANKTVRESAKQSARQAQDAAEAAADAAAESASKIGAAMINAATDAVRRMMATGGRPRRFVREAGGPQGRRDDPRQGGCTAQARGDRQNRDGGQDGRGQAGGAQVVGQDRRHAAHRQVRHGQAPSRFEGWRRQDRRRFLSLSKGLS